MYVFEYFCEYCFCFVLCICFWVCVCSVLYVSLYVILCMLCWGRGVFCWGAFFSSYIPCFRRNDWKYKKQSFFASVHLKESIGCTPRLCIESVYIYIHTALRTYIIFHGFSHILQIPLRISLYIVWVDKGTLVNLSIKHPHITPQYTLRLMYGTAKVKQVCRSSAMFVENIS